MADPVPMWLARRWWTLRRFGLSPDKLPRRLLNRDEPRVLCVTLPKSGTHLIERVLCLHPRLYRRLLPTIHEGNVARWGGLYPILEKLRPGQVALAHLRYTERRHEAVVASGVRTIVMIRDPRDVLVSHAFYVASKTDHPLHARLVAEPDLTARLRLLILGGPSIGPVRDTLQGVAGWLDAGGLVVRFEDLVGPAGGGDEACQTETLRSVFAHLGMPLDEETLWSLRGEVFSSRSPTFRRGAIGQWRQHFDDETRALLEREAGDLLARLGYAPGA